MKVRFMKELKSAIKVSPWGYFFKLLISVILRGLLLLIPILLGNLINELSKGNYEAAFRNLIFLAVSAIFYRLSESINNYVYHKVYNKEYQHNFEKYVVMTNNNSIFSLSRFTIGEYSNMVINDVNVVASFYTNLIIRVVQLLEFLFIYSYFLKLNIYLFIVVVVCSILIFLFSLKTTKILQKLNHQTKLNQDDLASSTSEYFWGVKEIKSFNIFDKIFIRLSDKMHNYLEANRKYNNQAAYFNQTYLLFWELVRLASVFYGIILLKNGQLEIGVILVIYNYYQKIIDNFSMILTINLDFRLLNLSLNRLNKIKEHSRVKPKLKNLPNDDLYGKIAFDKVLYGYKSNPTLNKVSFVINPNAITVINSKQSGAKTGVYDLLLKLNKQHEGLITLNEVDINEISDEEYFKLFSISREEPFFFNMSLKDNLMLIDSDYEKIIEVSKRIGLDDLLNNIEGDYNTKINNNANFNAVVKQLISIVRILIKDSKIMIFDEGIDLLDDATKKKLIKILTELAKDKTIIISTHDPKIKDIADKIINID